jgi:hypothetical protein
MWYTLCASSEAPEGMWDSDSDGDGDGRVPAHWQATLPFHLWPHSSGGQICAVLCPSGEKAVRGCSGALVAALLNPNFSSALHYASVYFCQRMKYIDIVSG